MASKNKAQRGRSRVRRHTYDIDDARAQVHAPLSEDGTYESSALVARALVETARLARKMTVAATRYGQGAISRVAEDALATLLAADHGFDHWSGTNDLAGSVLAKEGAFSKRQWQRVKPVLKRLGFIDYKHRSVKTGLGRAAGVDEDLQISDLYSFSPARLVSWLKEIFDAALARLKRIVRAREQRHGVPPRKTPLTKRDRPHRRIPALLNPAGWARALAAEAKALTRPTSYAEEEARAVAFATQLARNAAPG